MENIALVLGIFLLVCLAAIGSAMVLLSWVFAWDESSRIIRHRRQRRSMDNRLDEILSVEADR